MRNISLALACLVAVAIVGCESAQDQAAAKLGAKLDEAQRLHNQALSLSASGLTDGGTETISPDAIENPAVIDTLKKAKAAVEQGLKDGAEASEASKGVAYRTLSQIHQSMGDYRARVAENRVRVIDARIADADRLLDEAWAYAAVLAHYQELASVDRTAADSDLLAAKDRASTLTGRQRTLQTTIADLDKQVSDLAGRNNEKMADVAKLLNDAAVAPPDVALQKIREASGVQQEINADNAKINELRFTQEETSTELLGVNQQLAAADKQVEYISAALKDIEAQATVGASSASAERQNANQIRQQLEAVYAAMGEQVEEALTDYSEAIAAYDNAYGDARKAVDGAKALQGEARELSQNKPSNATKPILDKMSGNATVSLASVFRGQAALSAGDLRGRLIATATRLQQYADVTLTTCQDVGIPNPAGLVEVQRLAAGVDQTKVSGEAAKNYQNAHLAYDTVAKAAARQDRWVFEVSQIQALAGEYKLTGDATKLQAAQDMADDILRQYPVSDNPDVKVVEDIRKTLGMPG